ncbi:MAG: ribonuclease III [Bacillota bacterium]|uniref:ribonuclease III n=1 Tax=Desulfurispora thermophila TaxID=265470 RepID=UPI0003AAF4F7|nr:ribonuclease III [Desulfurispora thermophila]
MVNNRAAIDALKEKLHIYWQDEGLLELAMTHSSYNYENRDGRRQESNQRLEFLGDAVLELVISEHLYKSFPMYTEGELTKLRAAIVCEPSLARVARQLNLGACLYMGKGEEKTGGRERPSILADAFESLLGAVFLDQGLAVARRLALDYLQPVLEDILAGRLDRDYKTELQEYLQKRSADPVNYVILREEGPDHDKTFTAGVVHNGRELGRGQGHSKKEAEQQAARMALENLIMSDRGER